jgi:putative phosphoribosyl transferase
MSERKDDARKEIEDVRIPVRSAVLEGELAIPKPAVGLVLFAHGSGSGRKSPRNRFVARQLREAGVGTLLMDLLTREEEIRDREWGHLRFDVALLAERLLESAAWSLRREDLRQLPVGYFGASTGAAAALLAAAERPASVRAVVSRGGRPDLAGAALSRVEAPTLLIVGGADPEVLDLNRAALARLRCEKELRVVPGATHLFEEPGTLDEVARLAAAWFRRHLGPSEWSPSPNDRLESSVRGE